MPSAKAPKLTERALQQHIKRLFALAGCEVYDTSQGYRKEPGGTRMTPGLADLLVFLPPMPGRYRPGDEPAVVTASPVGFFEVKTPDGLKLHLRHHARGEKRAQHQALFAKRCRERGIPYAMGGMDEAWAFLGAVGLAVPAVLYGVPTGGWSLRRAAS